jgi:hypothetical protein
MLEFTGRSFSRKEETEVTSCTVKQKEHILSSFKAADLWAWLLLAMKLRWKRYHDEGGHIYSLYLEMSDVIK